MTQSPPGGHTRRARRLDGPEQWLDLPGWRKPLDLLLVLAVTFSVAWLALVVIPAAGRGGDTPIAEKADPTVRHTDAPPTDGTTDPSQWMAGPVYTGGPAAPPTEVAAEPAVVAAPVTQHRAPAPRSVSKPTAHPVPRPTAPPTPTPTVAQAAAAVTTAAPPATTGPAATTPTLPSSEPPTTSEPPPTTSETTSTPPTTSSPPSTSSPPTTSTPDTTTSSEPPTSSSTPATSG